MRTLEQIQYDKLRSKDCAVAAIQALNEYVDVLEDIQKRAIPNSSSELNTSRINNIVEAKRIINSEPEFPCENINHLLELFSYTTSKQLRDSTRCPRCGEVFPADLWGWYSDLYCPYCGQRVEHPQELREEITILDPFE